MPKNIIGITRTNSTKELAEIYSAADVFVNPTLEDNFPTTNLEALACGTPVITFKTGGSVESIDRNTGYIVEKGNIDDFIEKLKIIREKGKNYYFEHCIDHAASKFDKNDRYNDYINLYLSKVQIENYQGDK